MCPRPSGDVWLSPPGWGGTGTWWAEAGDAAEHLTMRRASLRGKDFSGSFKFLIFWIIPFLSTYALCFLCETSSTCQANISQSLKTSLCFCLFFLMGLIVARAKGIISMFKVLYICKCGSVLLLCLQSCYCLPDISY